MVSALRATGINVRRALRSFSETRAAISANDLKPTLSSTSSLVTMSERGGPLAQEHTYNYRSGWRQRTSDKPRTAPLHARRPHTVAERGRCTPRETCEPQRI